MRDLARKYRPFRLDQIVGQPGAVGAIERYLASGSNQTLLFVGPTGTSKTTCARIIAATKVCEESNRPCGKCGHCVHIFAGQMTFGYTEMDAARFNEPVHAKERAAAIKTPSFNYWATFIDEAHALDRAAQDALLKAAEEPNPNANFILATTEPLGLIPALRSRCLTVRFDRIRQLDLQRLLTDICGKEGILFEPKALAMLSVAADGSAREALNLLDRVAEEGDVTSDLVASTLALGDVSQLLEFFDSFLRGDFVGQEAALDNWTAEPVAIASLIREFLYYLYISEVAAAKLDDIVNAAFFQITREQRASIVEGFRKLAGSRALADYWLDLFDLWEFDPATISDRTSLRIKIARFQRAVHPEEARPDTSIAAPAAPPAGDASGSALQRPYRARSRLRAAKRQPQSAARFLDQRQAEHIYDMATFLPQQHGVLFNALLLLDHAKLGAGDEAAAGSLISQLTHELDLRARTWDPGAKAHWIYAHREQGGSVITSVVLHLPTNALERAEPWLCKRMQELRGEASSDAWHLDAASPARAAGWERNRVQRHWHLVRKLWLGLDPAIEEWNEERRRAPLIELLKVPRNGRSAIGELHELRSIGASRSLGPTRRKAAAQPNFAFLSAIKDDAWQAIFDGWELKEHRDRLRELERRREDEERIGLEFPVSANRLEQERRAEALASLRQSWPLDPHLRLRSWRGWWG